MLNSVLAKQIGEHIGCLFNKDAKLTEINKLFPSLFEAQEIEVNNEMALYKAKMDDFAFRHNNKLKRKEG
ncbi:MAG: hypothetical protein ACRCVJ_13045 [Clostridium sp.]|uniref:hypothetical protein n=1 Tax=Clostridium sp. TaxID=1506 RepID=UPI003F32551A